MDDFQSGPTRTVAHTLHHSSGTYSSVLSLYINFMEMILLETGPCSFSSFSQRIIQRMIWCCGCQGLESRVLPVRCPGSQILYQTNASEFQGGNSLRITCKFRIYKGKSALVDIERQERKCADRTRIFLHALLRNLPCGLSMHTCAGK